MNTLKIVLIIFIVFIHHTAIGNTLKYITKKGEIRIGLRDNLRPFSFKDNNNNFNGFAYDIAKLFTEKLSTHLKKNIRLIPVKISTQNRFEKILKSEIDIEIGSTSYSYKREEIVDFSIIYFFSETSILGKKGEISNMNDLTNKVIGVTKNTTNQEYLLKFIKDSNIKIRKIVYLDEHFDSVEFLKQNKIDAFCSDRTILHGILQHLDKSKFHILNKPIGYEPYAFMMQENNSDFRDFVNNFIVWMVKSGNYFKIYKKWVSDLPVSPFLKSYFSVISYDLPKNW